MRQMELKRFLFCFYLLTVAVLVMQAAIAKGAEPTNATKSLLEYTPPKTARLHEVLGFRPKKGHVFNLEAPNDCAGHEFARKRENAVRCQMKSTGPQTVSLFICDEKKTFCTQENHIIQVKTREEIALAMAFQAGQQKDTVSTKSAAARSADGIDAKTTTDYETVAEKKHKLVKKQVPGFLMNLPIAKYLAKKKGELILINYSSESCPPCERLRTEVFPTKEFQEATKNITKAYVDAYDHDAMELIAPFDFYWTPTFVLATPDFQEIGRFSGFQKTKDLLKTIAELETYKNEPIKAAIARLETEQKALKSQPEKANSESYRKLRRRVGLWYYAFRDYPKAMEILVGLTDKDSREAFLDSAMEVAEKAKDWDAWASYFKKYYSEFGNEHLAWARYALTGSAYEHKKAEIFDKYAPKLLKSLEQAIANYDPGKSKYKKTQLLSYRNTIQNKIAGKKDDEIDKQAEMKEYLAALEEQDTPKTEKGKIDKEYNKAWAALEMGKKDEARAIIEGILKRYPESYSAHARAIYYFEKKLEDKLRAFSLAKKALSLAEGESLTSMKLSVGSLAFDLGDKDLARTYVNEVITSLPLPKWEGAWIHYNMRRARKLEAKLDGRIPTEEKKNAKDKKSS